VCAVLCGYTYICINTCRYSDFVVHEIDKDGSVVRLTDINPPIDTEPQSGVTTEEVSSKQLSSLFII